MIQTLSGIINVDNKVIIDFAKVHYVQRISDEEITVHFQSESLTLTGPAAKQIWEMIDRSIVHKCGYCGQIFQDKKQIDGHISNRHI